MSVKVEGVLDLPHVDLRDLETLQELLLFIKENDLCEELKDYRITYRRGVLRVEHGKRNWSYFEIRSDGRIAWDEHYEETTKEKNAILDAIREFYPMFKKAMEIHKKVGGVMRYDKEEEKIILEVVE